jgi:hypothetical protein
VPAGSVEYADRDSDRTAIGPSFAFLDLPHPDEVDDINRTRLVHIKQRMILPSGFAYVVDGLEQVCASSVALGHPIFWT